MRLKIEFNDKAISGIKKSFISGVIRKTFQKSSLDFLAKKNILVSVAVVSPSEIRQLNRRYRKKDAITDILSFSEHKDIRGIRMVGDKEVFLGELVLCYDEVKRYAKAENIEIQKELAEVISHGTLHLLGFPHGKKMFQIQNHITKK